MTNFTACPLLRKFAQQELVNLQRCIFLFCKNPQVDEKTTKRIVQIKQLTVKSSSFLKGLVMPRIVMALFSKYCWQSRKIVHEFPFVSFIEKVPNVPKRFLAASATSSNVFRIRIYGYLDLLIPRNRRNSVPYRKHFQQIMLHAQYKIGKSNICLLNGASMPLKFHCPSAR